MNLNLSIGYLRRSFSLLWLISNFPIHRVTRPFFSLNRLKENCGETGGLYEYASAER